MVGWVVVVGRVAQGLRWVNLKKLLIGMGECYAIFNEIVAWY